MWVLLATDHNGYGKSFVCIAKTCRSIFEYLQQHYPEIEIIQRRRFNMLVRCKDDVFERFFWVCIHEPL